MKKSTIVFFLVFLSALAVSAQRKKNQLGLRVGEPMGISFKFFLTEKSAVECIVGTAAKEWSAGYYENSFKRYLEKEKFSYVDHQNEDVYYLQARYLTQHKIDWQGVPGRVDWYWGIGLLAKRASVEYTFRERGTPVLFQRKSVTDYDLGPEAIAGLEYTFSEIPLSLFMELSVCVELADRVGMMRGFPGIGIRYNF